MKKVFDVEKEFKRFKNKKVFWIILLVALLLIVIVGDVLGILLNKDNHPAIYISLVVVTIAVICFDLFIYGGPLHVANAYYKFFKSVKCGLSKKEILTINKIEDDASYSKSVIEGTKLTASFLENGKSYNREIYVLLYEVDLKVGDKIRGDIFSSVLLAYEKL